MVFLCKLIYSHVKKCIDYGKFELHSHLKFFGESALESADSALLSTNSNADSSADSSKIGVWVRAFCGQVNQLTLSLCQPIYFVLSIKYNSFANNFEYIMKNQTSITLHSCQDIWVKIFSF